MTSQKIVLDTLGLKSSTPEIDLDISRIEQKVKNFCNISIIPEELNYIVADMVVALQRKREGEERISTISEGDTTVTFKGASAIDKIIDDYYSDLLDYRRLRW